MIQTVVLVCAGYKTITEVPAKLSGKKDVLPLVRICRVRIIQPAYLPF